jgi:hypothetical protein
VPQQPRRQPEEQQLGEGARDADEHRLRLGQHAPPAAGRHGEPAEAVQHDGGALAEQPVDEGVPQLVHQHRDEHDHHPGGHQPQRFEPDAEQRGDDHEERLDADGDTEQAEVRPHAPAA